MKEEEFIELVQEAVWNLECQGEPCRDSYGDCKYNLGNKYCIVGWMMPDRATCKEADEGALDSLVDNDITSLYDGLFEWAQQFTDRQIKFMKRLQILHDDVSVDFEQVISQMWKEVDRYESGVKHD